jgi:hypothetical protein
MDGQSNSGVEWSKQCHCNEKMQRAKVDNHSDQTPLSARLKQHDSTRSVHQIENTRAELIDEGWSRLGAVCESAPLRSDELGRVIISG